MIQPLPTLEPKEVIACVEDFFKFMAKDKVTEEEKLMLQLAKEGLLAREKLIPAITELVTLKRIKGQEGKTPEYEKRQPIAWKEADEALRQWLALRTGR